MTALLRIADARHALVQGQPLTAKLELHLPWDDESVSIAGTQVPLESEPTAALALTFNDVPIVELETLGLLGRLSGLMQKRPPLVSATPYRPELMPVVFVHGTASSPVRWMEMYNRLLADPEIRSRFQFWFFQYDSGNPIALSALHLREALTAAVNGTAETDLDMRLYPFDRQRLNATFEVLGFDDSEVVFQPESSASRSGATVDRRAILPQWEIAGFRASVLAHPAPYAGATRTQSTLVVSVDVQRESFFMVRLVILPLMLMVMLSWSVFWMERSSLGDRISVSFIGILTAVAYQMVVTDTLPQISYFTLIHLILNLSFLLMCATVVINLVVGAFDRVGRIETGDLIDRRCRWIFPLAYFGLILLMVAVAFSIVPDAWGGA